MGRRFVDISIHLENGVVSDPPAYLPKITYMDHKESAQEMVDFFPGMTPEDLPQGEGWSAEWVTLITHNGTHLDAPYHFASTMNHGERAITIDEVPLDWCFRPGVKLDFRHLPDGYVVTAADGIDFEGEFGVITDAVPMGVSKEAARGHIRLLVQINDWSLRVIGREEMARGFGWVRAKPACSLAPVAITPDELGAAWAEAKVALPLHVWWNGELFGQATGAEMTFGFDDLVAHAAYSRKLCAGTVIGSGTVANLDYRTVGSSCILERRGIEILDHGEPRTPFLAHGDRVRMEARTADGDAPFGAIDQKVVVV